MELRHLEYFVAIAEEGSFTRAANRIHVAQSGLSASIQTLEKELGASLFNRSTRRITLTEAGLALLVEARRTLAAARAAIEAVAGVQRLQRGAVTIGLYPHQLMGIDLPALLARFHDDHPDVRIRIRRTVSPALLEELRLGAMDIAFTALLGEPPAGIATILLAKEPLVLICAPDHPLAQRQAVSLLELRSESFAVLTDVSLHPVRTTADQLFEKAGIERQITCEVTDSHTLRDVVALGFGVAVVPQSDVVTDDRVHYIPLRPPTAELDIVAAINEDPLPSVAARALLALISSRAAD